MANESINLNLIPKGEMPVIHVSQFDNGRQFTINLLKGSDEYTLPQGYTATLNCRKADRNIVTLATTSVLSNALTFTTTTQLCACAGKNLCEVAIKDAEDYQVGTLNFILEVEKDPLQGGIESTSEIHDLESQIEDITTEIISENYYTKTETDTLLDAKADAADVYTKTEVDTALSAKANATDVYTKSQVDTALSAKADATDVYTKSQVDTALSVKADAADVYTKSQVDTALSAKANAADVYTKAETNAKIDEAIDNILPVGTASGSIAVFNTALVRKPESITVNNSATEIYLRGFNQWDEVWANGYFNASTGVFIEDATNDALAAKNFIRVKPGSTYCIKQPGSSAPQIYQYQADGTFISRITGISTPYGTFTVADNCTYIKFISFNYGAGLYNDDICINVSGSENGTYQAYNSNSTDYPVSDINTIESLSCENVFFTDSGDISVTYKDTIQHYIDRKVGT